MYRVACDVSGVEVMAERAVEALGGPNVARAMRVVIDRGARVEKQGHHYRNRTGNAQRKTQARTITNTVDEARVELVAGAEYASFLYRGGWTVLDSAYAQTNRELEAMFANMADRIAGNIAGVSLPG